MLIFITLYNIKINQCIILWIFRIFPSRCLTVFIPFFGFGVVVLVIVGALCIEVLGTEDIVVDRRFLASIFGLTFFLLYCLFGAWKGDKLMIINSLNVLKTNNIETTGPIFELIVRENVLKFLCKPTIY